MTDPFLPQIDNNEPLKESECKHKAAKLKDWGTQPNYEKGTLIFFDRFWCDECNTGWTISSEYDVGGNYHPED